MIFVDRELKSIYDFGCVIPEDKLSITMLVDQLYNLTQVLHSLSIEKLPVEFKEKTNNNQAIFINYDEVSENTWYRSKLEIKEIVYRAKVNDKFQSQFSLNKGLSYFGIEEPELDNEYAEYLQLLYFFYIMNYFAFPKKNIFKLLKKDNTSFQKSFDIGTTQGTHLNFIHSSLLTNTDVLHNYIKKTTLFFDLSNAVSNQINEMNTRIDENLLTKYIDTFINEAKQSILSPEYDSLQCIVSEYFHNYAMYSYTEDLLYNLEDPDLYRFDPIQIEPPLYFKDLYIPALEVDDILENEDFYLLCKQKTGPVESRDIIKFKNSKAVLFLKNLIEYDIQFIKDMGSGIFIEIIDGEMELYTLRIATVIKTYNDLTNKLKVRISTDKQRKNTPLKSLLTTSFEYDALLPATLPIHYFMLACRGQYLNFITYDYYPRFYREFIVYERCVMKVFKQALSYNTLDETNQFLSYVYNAIDDLM